MKILALEFSSNLRSAAVWNEGYAASSAQEDRTVTAMQLLDRGLKQARLVPADIDLIAVGIGPGSYAGIRSAIAIAQGWQLARATRLIGISSLEVLAWEAHKQGIVGELRIVIDAQRREVYDASFVLDENGVHPLEPLRLTPIADLKTSLQVAGPSASQLITGARDLYPSAEILARLASTRSDFVAGEKLEPIYLRETSFVKSAPSRFG